VHIFQEFERLQRRPSGADYGLGLGLAIVQRYGELLGHPVQLRSTQGSGTLFSVTVTYGQAQSRPQSVPEETATRDLEGLRVLCLDNDPLILEGMEELLQTMGAQVTTAANREQLLSQFSNGGYPDIVLADYHLDGGDTGLNAVLEARKHNGSDIPCIIISADDSDVIRDRAKAVGYRFLPKPVNATRLRALVLALTRV
jgi:CheY-like chemotaxis protein